MLSSDFTFSVIVIVVVAAVLEVCERVGLKVRQTVSNHDPRDLSISDVHVRISVSYGHLVSVGWFLNVLVNMLVGWLVGWLVS